MFCGAPRFCATRMLMLLIITDTGDTTSQRAFCRASIERQEISFIIAVYHSEVAASLRRDTFGKLQLYARYKNRQMHSHFQRLIFLAHLW